MPTSAALDSAKTVTETLFVKCEACGRKGEVSRKAAGRSVRCRCGEKLRVPNLRSSQPAPEGRTTFVLDGGRIAIPHQCACCLERATQEVRVKEVKKEHLGVATLTEARALNVEFCETCGDHTLWHTLGGVSGALARSIVAGVVTTFLAGCLLALSFGGLTLRTPTGKGIVAGAIFVGLLGAVCSALVSFRRRPKRAVSHNHSCQRGQAVEIDGFVDTFTRLKFGNPAYGRLFADLNGG